MTTIKAGIIGATGYAGAELARLLMSHPNVTLTAVSSVSYEGKPLSEIYPNFTGVSDLMLENEDAVIEKSDVVFASLPHGLCEPIAKKCVDKGRYFIDLGADFRLYDEADYKEWYGLTYKEKELHDLAVYCIPELDRQKAKGAKIIANPGCYVTCASLGLAPLMKSGLADLKHIIIDAKSGVTGAGRGLSLTSHYPECNEAFSPYKIASHRHTPEIEQNLSALAGEKVTLTFVPHLLPVNRGIVSTIYVDMKEPSSAEALHKMYADFYQNEEFVTVLPLGDIVNLKNVRCTNNCQISVHYDKRTNRAILVSAIDNMVKGAAGQAIQNMNLVLGLPENAGLKLIAPIF